MCARTLPAVALVSFAALLLMPLPSDAAATFILQVDDAAGEGFNDPTAVAPVTGNPGATRGQQRLNAFQAAADFWGLFLDSSVDIYVSVQMNPLPCQPLGAVLGQAGPDNFFFNFPGAPAGNVWYPSALADALRGTDNDPVSVDIGATFNSDIDSNCFLGGVWWYGIGAPPPMAGQPDFFSTVLHELGHGLGFTNTINEANGMLFAAMPDIYTVFLEDHSLGTTWPFMTDGQRVNSAIDSGDLHWIGPNVLAAKAFLSQGVAGGHVRMYAPNPLEPGSSVSHWDTVLNPDELMEPSATDTYAMVMTHQVFRDEGWTVSGIFTDGFESGDTSSWTSTSP